MASLMLTAPVLLEALAFLDTYELFPPTPIVPNASNNKTIPTINLIRVAITEAFDQHATAACISQAILSETSNEPNQERPFVTVLRREGIRFGANSATLDPLYTRANGRSLANALRKKTSVSRAACASLCEWAQTFLSSFLIPMKNKGQTPSRASAFNSPRSGSQQAAMGAEIFRRDGSRCLLTGRLDKTASPAQSRGPADVRARLTTLHIAPFSLSYKPEVLQYIQNISGGRISAAMLQGSAIHHARNGFKAEYNIHCDFDDYLWGIEATRVGNAVQYHARLTTPNQTVCFTVPVAPLAFGGQDPSIALPDPDICNFHLAVGRIIHLSGAGSVIDTFWRDVEELRLFRGLPEVREIEVHDEKSCKEYTEYYPEGYTMDCTKNDAASEALYLLHTKLQHLLARQQSVEDKDDLDGNFQDHDMLVSCRSLIA